ncbi:hypothetical protein BC830DRAFT_1219925 [Chytriomyces sp. MP71]|nr:hypothetical protein BC830DRAFT_1219925 [Chytriomyces sp. MP71]
MKRLPTRIYSRFPFPSNSFCHFHPGLYTFLRHLRRFSFFSKFDVVADSVSHEQNNAWNNGTPAYYESLHQSLGSVCAQMQWKRLRTGWTIIETACARSWGKELRFWTQLELLFGIQKVGTHSLALTLKWGFRNLASELTYKVGDVACSLRRFQSQGEDSICSRIQFSSKPKGCDHNRLDKFNEILPHLKDFQSDIFNQIFTNLHHGPFRFFPLLYTRRYAADHLDKQRHQLDRG